MRLTALAEQVLGFCYPTRCANCEIASDDRLCPVCEEQMVQLEQAPACVRCGMPVVEPFSPCARCTGQGMYPYERVLRLGTFDQPIKSLIHQMKYHRRWSLGELLADRLLARPGTRPMLEEIDGIMPVPLHYWRQLMRGYNQAEVIARRLARATGRRLVQPVRRVRNTETQTHLHSRTKRTQNLRDAFHLADPKQVYGRRIAVVDDVLTTGATLQSVGRTLAQAKPASLIAIVIAVADPKHQDFQKL
jgi:ComF family protein